MKPKKIKAKIVDLIDPANPSDMLVYSLPADAASVEAMVEQMARTIQGTTYFATQNHIHAEYHDQARAALAAIGIKSTK